LSTLHDLLQLMSVPADIFRVPYGPL
jgi:hypothetical protein